MKVTQETLWRLLAGGYKYIVAEDCHGHRAVPAKDLATAICIQRLSGATTDIFDIEKSVQVPLGAA